MSSVSSLIPTYLGVQERDGLEFVCESPGPDVVKFLLVGCVKKAPTLKKFTKPINCERWCNTALTNQRNYTGQDKESTLGFRCGKSPNKNGTNPDFRHRYNYEDFKAIKNNFQCARSGQLPTVRPDAALLGTSSSQKTSKMSSLLQLIFMILALVAMMSIAYAHHHDGNNPFGEAADAAQDAVGKVADIL
ncbi:hypothetical protein TNCV_3345791 [Trichonephila clavipes]|nr:hypothetical protein TNCV_3345791 [Trichonephila clavipes]